MKFRTDINGLRTYAVLAVIIFHFNKEWLPGGFAGVDVFFVISGYLMTSIIFRGLEANNFSLWKFYGARIRRIIPALLVLIVILMIFGYLFLAPIPYRELAKHSEGSLLFISNIMYWQEAGYFDAEAIEKFLLHTWSLSVEWQFYIIYPIVLLLFAKLFSAKTIKKIIAIATIFAFFFAVYASFRWNVASYFLLPTRIWEMLLGGIVFLYPLKLSKTQHKHTLELIGLGLIVISFFIISEHTVWPGYMALLPTGGAFLLLQANNQTSYFTNTLVMQKLGLWSYSLYLYHWPLLVINHKFNLQLSIWVFLVITIVLSVLSYYFIEIKRWKVRNVLIALGIVLIPIGGVDITKGASFRTDPKYSLTAKEFHSQYYGGTGFPTHQEQYINSSPEETYDYYLFGDSFARQYANYIKNSGIKTRNWFGDGCIFLKTHSQYSNGKEFRLCSDESDKVYDILTTTETKPIIWAQNWKTYSLIEKGTSSPITSYSNQDLYHNILETNIIELISTALDKNIYLIGIPSMPENLTFNCLAETELLGQKILKGTCEKYSPQQDIPINILLEKIAYKYPNVYYIDPNPAFCKDKQCQVIINGEPTFSDMGHLSIFGADLIGEYIFEQINSIQNKDNNTPH